METITITTEFIKLQDLLKLSGLVYTGEIVSCAWFRDHLGSVGTMLFGEAPQGENVQ